MDATGIPPRGEPLLTMPQAARAFGRSPEWVKGRCDAAELVCWVVNGRRYTTAREIAAYLDRRKVIAAGKPVPRTTPVSRAHAEAVEALKRMGVPV